jgi:hypothetical protein
MGRAVNYQGQDPQMLMERTPDTALSAPNFSSKGLICVCVCVRVRACTCAYMHMIIQVGLNLCVCLTFRGLCIVIYSNNESQRNALFLKFI